MARSINDICNEAIADVPAKPIINIDDQNQKEARECALHLPGIVEELIAAHDYDFVRRRIALAATSNDREFEWAYAYALPDEIISPIQLVPNYDSSTTTSIVVTPILYWYGPSRYSGQMDYVVADGTLYTNLGEAILEYSVEALEPAKWSPLFAKAVIRHLSARIYRPILGAKADTQEKLVKERLAKAAENEAIADDLNRNPRHRRDFVSDAEAARMGSFGWGAHWRR